MPFFHKPFGVETEEGFFQWSDHNFDKVIYLLRRDTQKQSESFCFRLFKTHENPNFKWHDQISYDMDLVPKEKIRLEKGRMDDRNNYFLNKSTETNNPVYYYEDLIINEGDNQTLKNLLSYLHLEYNDSIVKRYYGLNKKCRVNPKESKTLI